MTDQPQPKVIADNPIGNGLDAFRASLKSICEDRGISCTPAAVNQLGQEGRGTLRSDLSRLNPAVNSQNFDFDRIKPFLDTVLTNKPDNGLWGHVYNAVLETTPPLRPTASSLQQTPWLRNMSSFASSSEHPKYVDNVHKEELGPMYVGLRDFYHTYFEI